jgi:hypothetical protein
MKQKEFFSGSALLLTTVVLAAGMLTSCSRGDDVGANIYDAQNDKNEEIGYQNNNEEGSLLPLGVAGSSYEGEWYLYSQPMGQGNLRVNYSMIQFVLPEEALVEKIRGSYLQANSDRLQELFPNEPFYTTDTFQCGGVTQQVSLSLTGISESNQYFDMSNTVDGVMTNAFFFDFLVGDVPYRLLLGGESAPTLLYNQSTDQLTVMLPTAFQSVSNLSTGQVVLDLIVQAGVSVQNKLVFKSTRRIQ